jgi:tetratricopeptide (TPR) repeat protein
MSSGQSKKFPMLSSVKKDFLVLSGILPYFKKNRIEDRRVRGNNLFAILSEHVFDQPRLLCLLLKKISSWVKKDPSEFTLCLAGYIFYIAENYQKSEHYFLKALEKSPDNLDTWFDLAFSLYHQGKNKQELALKIIFQHELLAKNCPLKRISLINLEQFLKQLI